MFTSSQNQWFEKLDKRENESNFKRLNFIFYFLSITGSFFLKLLSGKIIANRPNEKKSSSFSDMDFKMAPFLF